MKIKLLLLIILLNVSYTYSQEKKVNVRIKALDVGVYNYSKVKKNTFKALYGEKAIKALEARIEGNQILIDFIGGYLLEQEIISYYPQEDIVLFGCPARGAGVHDLKNMRDGYGDPGTYVYSTSGKYRFSTLEADGIHYYLEKKIDGEYVYLGDVFPVTGSKELSGFYWHNEETLYYLKERQKSDGTIYWVGYSATFIE